MYSFLKSLRLIWGAMVIVMAPLAVRAEAVSTDENIENTLSNVGSIPTEKLYPDYETQIIDIFKTLLASKQPEGDEMHYPVFKGKKAQKLLKTYLAKMQNHEMHIKNIVFRTDNRNIRVTWGDHNDHYLFKIAYTTDRDRVLVNSRYANKNKISDIKLIFYENNKLNYVWIYRQAPDRMDEKSAKLGNDRFIMYFNMAEERCGFCHELAKHDGSHTGLFFTRYQYKKEFTGTGLDKVDEIFKAKSFVLTKKSDTIIANILGDKMPDEFYYQRFRPLLADSKDQSPVYSVLLEMPELIEVLARDNNKSYCLSIQYEPNEILSNENYICADVEKKKLYVHYQNPWNLKRGMTPDGSEKPFLFHYVKDFWNNPVMSSDPSTKSSGDAMSEKPVDNSAAVNSKDADVYK